MSRFLPLIIGIFFYSFARPQSANFSIRFEPTFAEESFKLGKHYLHPNGKDSIVFTQLKWYISSIQLVQNDSVVFTNKNYYLLDVNDTLIITFDVPNTCQFNGLLCLLGIDSTSQVNGAQSGNLDPIHGMYWTWQSGYIHYKLEGKCTSCLNKTNSFNFHIGGYQGNHATQQALYFKIPQNTLATILTFDAFNFLPMLNLSNECNLMLPGPKAKLYAIKMKESWRVKQ